MDSYEQLRLILEKHPAGAPPSKKFDEILRLLFTPEEVKVALGLTFAPRPIGQIAQAAGVSEEEAKKRCEAMADKGIVFSRSKGGQTGYSLLPTIPGLFEFPFMKGGGTPLHQKLGPLWEAYHHEALGNEFAGSRTPFTRVIPIEELIEAQNEVVPYEVITRMLGLNEFFALAQCACRVSLGACDKPRDVCLIFDQTGRYLVERGHAREITREEAQAVVRRAEEAGLVHMTNNSQDRLNLICNCCSCCCTLLRGLTQLENPNAFARARWQAQVAADQCTACGVCEDDRCPVGAIAVQGDAAEVNPQRCIGCGLCATACDAEAIVLVPREGVEAPPATASEMGLRALTEKGRAEAFLKLMKR